MKRSTLESSLLELTRSLAPTAVSQFLASQSWELEARQDHVREIWRLPDHGPQAARIMLPLATDFVDFPERFYDALNAIGRLNDWDAASLYEHIIATRADLLYIRLDQAMPDGTIPFRQAEVTITAVHRMMKAAATTAASPQHSGRGRRPAAVSEFLDEDVRLGHTKRGSFIFTVVTRMDDEGAAPEVSGPPDSTVQISPFPRKVMETLAKGLITTDHLTRGRDREAYDSPGDWGVSAGLVESLEEMTRAEGLRALDLTFEWASTGIAPAIEPAPIRLEYEVFGELARVKERLVRQEEPPRRETLLGRVKSLTREDGEMEDEGSIVISADVNGKDRNVRLTLSGEDHNWAIRAYQAKIPIVVTGDLSYERRSWRLTGEIELDSSFLRHQLGENPEQ